MKISDIKSRLVAALSYFLILTCLSCDILEEYRSCGDDQLIASLKLGPTLLGYLPENIEGDKIFVNADGLEKVYSINIDSGNNVLRNQLLCSNAGNHSSKKYYDSEFIRITFTSESDKFIVELRYIGENEQYWHKPYETLILYRKEDDRGSRRIAIIPDSEAAQKHDEVYQNYHEELSLGDRTFTEVYESIRDDWSRKYYYSVGQGVIAFEQSDVLWLIKE